MARNKFDIDEEIPVRFNFRYLLRLLSYIIPYKKKMFAAVILMLLANSANLAIPMMIKITIDDKIPHGDITGLIIMSGLLTVIIAVSGICLNGCIWITTNVGQILIKNIREDLFKHLQRLSFTYFDSRPHGKILVRVVNNVNSLNDLLSNGLINMISDLISLLIILVLMFLIDVRLTLICLAGFPVLAAMLLILNNFNRKTWQDVSRKLSNMNAYIHESINGIRVTQSFTREDENRRIFKDLSHTYRRSWMIAAAMNFMLWPLTENISVLVVSFVYMAGIMWIGYGITIGVLFAFIGYIWRFWLPMQNLGNFYNQIVIAMAYLENIFEMMDEKILIEEAPQARELDRVQGLIEFRNVSFWYEEGKEVLHNISFSVSSGSTNALVGHTGSGKTTIINLLSRFYDIQKGSIYIDGINIKDVTLYSLRKNLGIMLQDTFIFSGTVLENIRYGRLDATEEEVEAASRAVCAHDFIVKMKDGYHTQVNERGSRLSLGQRQLISFARTLLADPRLLVLDEATSSVDTDTEMAIQKGLARLLKGRTSIIIAHRMSTIRYVDKIFFINHGKIEESGTHDELLKLKGGYYHLYRAQFQFKNQNQFCLKKENILV